MCLLHVVALAEFFMTLCLFVCLILSMQSSDQEALKKLFAENGKSEEKVITQFD